MKKSLTLGEFITKKREELGYGKIDFSKLIGVGDDSLRSWEKNRFIPAGINRTRLIEVLELSPKEIKEYFTYRRSNGRRQTNRV